MRYSVALFIIVIPDTQTVVCLVFLTTILKYRLLVPEGCEFRLRRDLVVLRYMGKGFFYASEKTALNREITIVEVLFFFFFLPFFEHLIGVKCAKQSRTKINTARFLIS